MIYGYARVSTHKQVIRRQVEKIIRAYPTAKVYSETYTGTTDDRLQWQKLLKIVEKGDTIVFDSVSRMSRDADDGIKLYMELYEKGISLVFLNEPYINTATYKQAIQGSIATVGNEIADIYINATNEVLKLLAKQQIKQAFEQAEKEVKDLKTRTSEGMKAKGAGKKISKARTGKRYETKKSKKIKELILLECKDFGGTSSDKVIIERLNGIFGKPSKKRTGEVTDISSTYYKYKRELFEENGQLSGQMKFKD